MSALTAQTTTYEQPSTLPARRYPLRVRAMIMIGSAAGLWGLLVLAGWLVYRAIA
ncbi:MAG: hypothetical protein JWL84_650 [Rhodospirillales bacterium]|jgi:hypothetical protein|nr:hypothetical protein [Rhodospirillales bacterium]